MIRHILVIQFKPKASDSSIERVKEAFLAIPTKIAGVESVEWGVNNSPENLNRNFTHCVLMTFADEEARQRYLPHPEHEALKEKFLPVLNSIVVLDYEVLMSTH